MYGVKFFNINPLLLIIYPKRAFLGIKRDTITINKYSIYCLTNLNPNRIECYRNGFDA